MKKNYVGEIILVYNSDTHNVEIREITNKKVSNLYTKMIKDSYDVKGMKGAI